MAEALLATDLTLPNKRIGKVRDLYDVTLASGDEALLIIATDRISAFDVVMQNGLPGKGVVLTQISKFWFDHFASEIDHHFVSTDVADVPGLTDAQRQALNGRIMLCRKTEVVPIECIARGYITGSGWKDYQNSGTKCRAESVARTAQFRSFGATAVYAVDQGRRRARREHQLRRGCRDRRRRIDAVARRENAEPLQCGSRLRWRARHYSRGHQVRVWSDWRFR